MELGEIKRDITKGRTVLASNVCKMVCLDQLSKGGNKTEFSEDERKKLAESGQAMPDGSFPIRNRQDLLDAVKSVGRASDPEEAKSWIKKRAGELNCEDCLPEGWGDEDSSSDDDMDKGCKKK